MQSNFPEWGRMKKKPRHREDARVSGVGVQTARAVTGELHGLWPAEPVAATRANTRKRTSQTQPPNAKLMQKHAYDVEVRFD
jgi:ribonuclease I